MKIIPKEIKRRARAALTGYYFPAVSMTISLTLFTTALSLLVSASGLYGSPRALSQALYWILYGITLLLGALLETGLVRFLYSLNRRQPLRERGALFFAFRSQADSYILAYAFRYLVTLVWFAPALYFYMRIPLVIDPANPPADLAFNAGMTLLLALAALVPAVLLALPWCLTTYVLLDHPDISVLDALKAITINAAFQYFQEDRKGTLAPGKCADLVVLSRDPLQTPKEELDQIQVLETWKDGERVYQK